MTTARADILATLRAALGRTDSHVQDVLDRLAGHPAGIIPARGQLARAGRLALFSDMAEEAGATVAVVHGGADIPAAVAAWLAGHNLAGRLRMAPDPALGALPWATEPLLNVSEGAAGPDDEVGLVRAFAGVAETGTLVLVSGPKSPTTLNFLPENHIVVLPASVIAGAYEEAWTRLRQESGPGGDIMPRTVNWITGPSRTGDIEQKLMLGVHGPRRLHIIVVEDD